MERTTKQRSAIATFVESLDGFHSAQEIHALLATEGVTVGLATVYRALTALAAEGSLDQVQQEDGQTLYRRCSTAHHHHLRCRECGHTVEVTLDEGWADQIAAQHGFRDISHSLELIGICPECAAK
jgi:Fur family transcriptional regulator, ferric uptake regulator